jgi:adenylyltransferase/sulfurtransferase
LVFASDFSNPSFYELVVIRIIHGYFRPTANHKKRISLQPPKPNVLAMKEITARQLHEKIQSKADFQLIDVREEYEYEAANLGGQLIPMGQVFNEIDKIDKNKDVVVYCRSGNRSGVIINELEKRFGFHQLVQS